MTGLELYGEQLVAAAERLHRPRARSRWIHGRRRGLIALVVGIAVAAPALAATQPWTPLLGSPEMHDQPEPTAAPPPRDQLAALSVLRRAQSDRDRDAVAQNALRYFGKTAVEIRTPFVRVVGPRKRLGQAVLVPAAHWDPAGSDGPSQFAVDNPLCVFVPAPNGDGGGKACFSLDQIRAGEATGALGGTYWGVVPDGVVAVRASDAKGVVHTAAVTDNYYTLDRAPRGRQVTWLDADGVALRTRASHAPSITMPLRARYRGRWISIEDAARLHLSCVQRLSGLSCRDRG